MLLQLDIKNYAIIEQVSIPFSDNLNVITGETGAGKSILLGALSLILGLRADRGVLREKGKKAIIEGTFRLPENPEIKQFFPDQELDYAPETIIRREINPSGKSRSFINDTPVNLQQLSAFTGLLVDLHQQFDTLQLGQADFQLQVLDLLAGQKSAVNAYQKQYQEYLKSKRFCETLEEEARQLSKEQDFDRFLFNELEEAAFSENELEELEEELQMRSHTEDLKRGLETASGLLEMEDGDALSQLRATQGQLENLASFHKKIPDLIKRISSVRIELQDIADEIQQINDQVEYDEERVFTVQERINTGYKLLKKHHLQTTSELLELKGALQQKLLEAENVEERLKEAAQIRDRQQKEAQKLANQLSAEREKQIQPFVKNVQKLLKRVGMPNARIKVLLEQEELKASGQDTVSFEFDANKSGRFLPVRKVASGGELSRLMLCIKSLIADKGALPTLIFDEIESGISGEAARQVGLILSELAATHQVICISHQPQIAGKAHTHFQVYKFMEKGKVYTGIRQLTRAERIEVIAGMLSGDKPTAAALENAKELMER